MQYTLDQAIDKVIETLLSLTPHTDRPCYAPNLRELAINLKTARETEGKNLRPDVQAFALQMAEVMDAKELEKGKLSNPNVLDALTSLGLQFGRFREMGIFADKSEMKRILVHIANFAMIACIAFEKEEKK